MVKLVPAFEQMATIIASVCSNHLHVDRCLIGVFEGILWIIQFPRPVPVLEELLDARSQIAAALACHSETKNFNGKIIIQKLKFQVVSTD